MNQRAFNRPVPSEMTRSKNGRPLLPRTGFMAAGGMDIPEEALDSVVASLAADHPLGRVVSAEDCAEAAVFLCSDRAHNITGVLMPVDGGYVAR